MSYTQKEIMQKSGMAPYQIQFYVLKGVVEPEEGKGEGRGRVRRYSRENLLDFLLIKQLLSWGMTVGKIKNVLKIVKNQRATGMLGLFTKDPCYLIIYRKDDGAVDIGLARVPSWRWSDTGQKIEKVEDLREDKPVVSFEKMRNYSACLVVDYSALVRKVNGG